MLEQGSVLCVQIGDSLKEISRGRDLTRSSKVHDSLGGVDAVSDVVAPRLKIDRFFDGAEVEARAQAAQGDTGVVSSVSVILRNRQRHVKRVFRIGDKRDQRAVTSVLDPVVGLTQRTEIVSQTRGQCGFCGVLLLRTPFRETHQIGKKKTRHYRADGWARLSFDHGRLTIKMRRLQSLRGSFLCEESQRNPSAERFAFSCRNRETLVGVAPAIWPKPEQV